MSEEVESLQPKDFISSLNSTDCSYLPKGTMVMVYLKDLFSVSVCGHKFFKTHKTQKLPIFSDTLITLLKYEGEGKFSEFYTGEIIQFAPLLDYGVNNSYYGFVRKYSFQEQFGSDRRFNSEEFVEQCSYFSEHPILIGKIPVLCSCVDNIIEVEERLAKQFSLQESLIKNITAFREKAIADFKKSCDAYEAVSIIEEQVENFKNGISLSMSLKKNGLEKDAE